MAIKTLVSAQKNRDGRESGNTTFIFLGLTINDFRRVPFTPIQTCMVCSVSYSKLGLYHSELYLGL